eukprot:scaffold12688_cov146-Isochrysis_galbana.AAC.2
MVGKDCCDRKNIDFRRPVLQRPDEDNVDVCAGDMKIEDLTKILKQRATVRVVTGLRHLSVTLLRQCQWAREKIYFRRPGLQKAG